jgi:hypothetical protein
MSSRIASALFVVLMLLPATVLADDFYVIIGTHKTQKEAQEIAAIKGGWVLNTNFYNQLTPNLYAVARGPFRTKGEADKHLASLMKGGRYPGSYVKNAGTINIEVKIGNKALSPHMVAALLGEIRIDVKDENGGSHPCEPQEPYKQLSLSYVTIDRKLDEKKDQVLYKPEEVELEVGAFREIKRTGEIERMRICAE